MIYLRFNKAEHYNLLLVDYRLKLETN